MLGEKRNYDQICAHSNNPSPQVVIRSTLQFYTHPRLLAKPPSITSILWLLPRALLPGQSTRLPNPLHTKRHMRPSCDLNCRMRDGDPPRALIACGSGKTLKDPRGVPPSKRPKTQHAKRMWGWGGNTAWDIRAPCTGLMLDLPVPRLTTTFPL